MMVSKLNLIFVLCFVSGSLSKPTADFTQARGVGNTLWTWISYPFSWWSSDPEADPSINDNTTSIYGLNENELMMRQNVTVWCNTQTCTTMRCDKNGCYNTTCNMYDTYVTGECRVYNTLPIKPIEVTTPAITDAAEDKVTEAAIKPTEVTIETTSKTPVADQSNEERPLELEAVLSSSVHQLKPDNKNSKEQTSKLNNVIS